MNKHLVSAFLFFLCINSQGIAGPALASQNPSSAVLAMRAGYAPPQSDRPIELTLADAIYLGLQGNRTIRTAYIERIAQRFDLAVAENRFTPKLVLNSRALAQRSDQQSSRTFEVSPVASMISPIGTKVSLAWTSLLDKSDLFPTSRNDTANITLVQPLLRDAGWAVGTAPVQLARLGEEANVLSLKTQLARVVTQIIYGYRELLRAQEQVKIGVDPFSWTPIL